MLIERLVYTLKTIREIAERVGVSKTAVYALIKNHKIPTLKKGNLTYVDEGGVSLILAHYSSSQHETIKDIFNDSINVDSQVENNQIVTILEKQLDEKQEVIRGLLQALENEQRQNENEQKLKTMPLLSSPADKSLGFFRRLFGRSSPHSNNNH